MIDLDDLKTRVNIVDLIGATVKLRKSGNAYTGLCPFHPHTNYTPSFAVWPEIGAWKCFGTCNEGGDAFKFVMKRDGCDFKAALETVKQFANMPAPAPATDEPRKPRPGGPPSGEWQGAARLVIEHCQKLIGSKHGHKAHAWLIERGIGSATIEAFGLGVHPRPANAAPRQLGAELFGIWVPFGLVIPCVVGGVVWYLKVRTGHDHPKYLNAKGFRAGDSYESVQHPALFNAASLLGHDYGMVVESELDAILFAQDCGDIMGAASLGAQGYELEPGQWARYLIGRKRVFAHYDTDGKSEKGAAKFVALSHRIERVAVPEGKDLTRYRQAHGREGLRLWACGCIGLTAEPYYVNFYREGECERERVLYAPLVNGEEVRVCVTHDNGTATRDHVA